MDVETSLARIAALMGEPARALMLVSLLDGRSRTAGELAQAAGIAPQTASMHLAKLVDAGLLAIQKQGRHRYHRLGGSDVAHALEALMAISHVPLKTPRLGPADIALRHARTCYDHMAGAIAVDLAGCWLDKGWIVCEADQWRLSAAGCRGFAALDIPLPDPSLRRPPLRPCLDWSERRPHLGGQLGAAILASLLARDWVRRSRGSRALSVTAEGARLLECWRR
jgi:DNA-binding transcriptional ArsR family regulator